MTYHFIYKTTSPSGKYYIGRHSTTDLHDGYVGSGKWVRSIKDRRSLVREILAFCDDFDTLLITEQQYLTEHVGQPNCMNFNNSPVGFASGDLNPAKTELERAKRSERLKLNNPGQNPNAIRARMEAIKSRPSPLKGTQKTEEAKQKLSNARTGIKISEEGRRKLSESRKRQYENGERVLPSFKGGKQTEDVKQFLSILAKNREKIQCPHCGKFADPGNFNRWHGDKCKAREDLQL